MTWTDARIEHLKKRWAEGASCSQIARELPPCTRNAIIGKVHRLNLVGRPVSARPGPAPGSRPRRSHKAKPKPVALVPGHSFKNLAAKRSAPLPKVRPVLASDPARPPCSIIEIDKDGCRYCVSEPTAKQALFCNQLRRDRDTQYCEAHAAGVVDLNPRRVA